MTIEFLTEDDPLYILPFFEEFLRTYAGRHRIVQVSCCPVMGSRPRRQLLRELTWLYGITGIARLLTRYAFSRVLGLIPLGPGARSYYSIAQVCAAHGVPYARVGNPNDQSFTQGLAQRGADLLVSVACPYILKSHVLAMPRMGCINLHHAPLPRYKGMMPTFWQLYHGETKVGFTIHSTVPKLDAGSVLLQESHDVLQGETLDQLIRRSKRRAAHALARVLGELEE
jgi:methionyl-tRNA formyltransferase